jgi:site-specific recombinase XerD
MKQDDRFFKYVRGFLTVYLPRQKCCSDHTVKAYKDAINLLRLFLEEEKHTPFTKITFDLFDHTLVGEFMDWLKTSRNNSASTRKSRLTALKSFFNYAATEDPSLMVTYIELKKVPTQKLTRPNIEYMSEKALSTILSQPKSTRYGMRDRFVMVLMYDTAARVQELLDLRLSDLRLSDSTPCVYLTGKGRKTRAVPLMQKTIEHFDVYMKEFHSKATRGAEDLLFYTVIKGKVGRMSEDNVASFLKRYGISARRICPEVPERVYPHLFRHTRAMHLYQMGMPLSYIKDFLGHTSVNATDVYARADVTMLKTALEKASQSCAVSDEQPIWLDNEELILKLCGLE